MSRLAQQIGRCHASNKSLSSPVHLTLCNLKKDSKFYKELCRINDGFDRYVINKSDKSIQDYYESNMENIAYLRYRFKTSRLKYVLKRFLSCEFKSRL